MNLPHDLPGGWEHNGRFCAAPLKAEQIWRKTGPLDAIKIERVMQPGHPEDDGGAQGISTRSTKVGSKDVIWERKTWFKLGNRRQIHSWLKEHGYSLAN